MNFSAWDSIPSTKRYNPALSSAHVTVEFNRTKKIKIFSHKLGGIDFSRSRDLNEIRQETIDREKGNLTLNGFKYKNIGHVYSDPEVIESKSENNYEFDIYSHGHPLGGTEYGGLESCSRVGLQCKEGSGSDGLCLPGKCVIGTLSRVKDTKWRYESTASYAPNNLPVIYYISTKELVTLKPILRGIYSTYNEGGLSAKAYINVPASLPTKVLLPPRFYYSDDFLESLFTYRDERLQLILNPPVNDKIGYETRKDRFVRKIVKNTYPDKTEGAISASIKSFPKVEIKESLISFFEGLDKAWFNECLLIIEEEFLFRFIRQYSTVEYVSAVYDRILKLFSSIIQITESSVSSPRLSYDKDRISRPVYSRLPGVSESYRSDPAFSDNETPAQWLTSGVDDFLSKKKDSIATFYQRYLDPETCSSLTLDWLAQHVGLTGPLWKTEWDRKIKETMIRNAFGWWDREAFTFEGNITPKGEALNKFPFTNPEWTDDEEESNLLSIKLDSIETIKVDNGVYDSYESFKVPNNDLSELIEIENLKINKLLWNGLIESKGSLLAICFLVSIFGLKSHSPEELLIVDAQRKILKPKTGLRNAEISAPPLLPYKYQVAQVGTQDDAEVGNYTNQLIAGMTKVSSIEESLNMFFRVPYYYNRDGKSWDRVTYIAQNWMPFHVNVRVQYPYLSADLWSVGDGFFEPEIIEIGTGV